MSDWYFWFFWVTLGVALISGAGYGYFRSAITDRDISWGLRFLWQYFFSTLAWLGSLALYWASGLADYGWFGKPQPWWFFLGCGLGGLLGIYSALWVGHLASPSREEGDPYADPNNYGRV